MPAVVIALLWAMTPLPDAELARRAEELFERGLERRQQGEKSRALFEEAGRQLEELRQRGFSNATLQLDLGNAYLLAGDLPRAILAYRHGLRLAPGNRALRGNLRHARQRVIHLEGSGLGRPPEAFRPAWLPDAPRSLFAVAVLAYGGVCVCLTRWYMVRRRRWLVAALAAVVVSAAATALLAASTALVPDRPVVVIAADGVLLRKGNGRSFPPRVDTPLGRGVEASLLYRKGGWLQVELSGGEVGWVQERDAVVEQLEGDQP
jgi:hypothetical protein